MAINIKIGTENDQDEEQLGQQEQEAEEKKLPPPSFTSKLKIRKALDGSVMLFDHDEIDIVIVPDKMKIITFSKQHFSDYVYAAQSRLFEF